MDELKKQAFRESVSHLSKDDLVGLACTLMESLSTVSGKYQELASKVIEDNLMLWVKNIKKESC